MSTENYHTRKTCRVCGTAEFFNVLSFPNMPFGDEYVSIDSLSHAQSKYPLTLVVCEACRLLQILEVVNPCNLYLDYLYESKTSVELKNHFDQYADYLCDKWKLAKGDSVLEIGCNDGMLLFALANRGLKVVGVDPAKRFASFYYNQEIGFFNDFFSLSVAQDILNQFGQFDAVIANNVFANVDDLGAFCSGIHLLLAQDGYFFMESGWSLPLIQGYVVDNVHHEHYSYFGVGSFGALCQKNNLRLIDVQEVGTKGGSLRYVAVRSDGVHQKPSLRVDEMLKLEEATGLYENKAYITFKQYLEEIKQELLTTLIDFREKGKRIAGYGASVGTTTLMYYFDISEYIECLYDDNPIKIGSYSPVDHIPVKDSSEIYADRPDVIFVFCWRYFPNILARHGDFINKHGVFIVPLPFCHIVDKSVINEKTEMEPVQ